MTDWKKAIESLKVPNWALMGTVTAIILVFLAAIYAFSSGDNAAQSVQMLYQLALVIAGLIGLPLAIWRSWTAHRQAETGQKQLETSQRQLEGFQRQISLAEIGAEADRLQKGTELLESEGLAIRIAGIAILRGIAANRDHRYKREAFSVLEAFARSISDRQQPNPLAFYPSPEDLIEAFKALMRTQSNCSGSVGRISIHGGSFSSFTLGDYTYSQVTFNRSVFHAMSVSSESYLTFRDCDFYTSEIDFEEHMSTGYERCEFHECKLKGVLMVDSLNSCMFVNCNDKNLHADKALPAEKAAKATS